jgi:hypothetical protein
VTDGTGGDDVDPAAACPGSLASVKEGLGFHVRDLSERPVLERLVQCIVVRHISVVRHGGAIEGEAVAVAIEAVAEELLEVAVDLEDATKGGEP